MGTSVGEMIYDRPFMRNSGLRRTFIIVGYPVLKSGFFTLMLILCGGTMIDCGFDVVEGTLAIKIWVQGILSRREVIRPGRG